MATRAAKKTTRKKTAKKKGPVRRAAAPRRKSSGTKRRSPSAAFMKPMQPSEELSAIVGEKAMPRTEVVKKVWAYIKRHGLQDRRNINADENLKGIFGGKRSVNMFEMMSLVNKHLS